MMTLLGLVLVVLAGAVTDHLLDQEPVDPDVKAGAVEGPKQQKLVLALVPGFGWFALSSYLVFTNFTNYGFDGLKFANY